MNVGAGLNDQPLFFVAVTEKGSHEKGHQANAELSTEAPKEFPVRRQASPDAARYHIEITFDDFDNEAKSPANG